MFGRRIREKDSGVFGRRIRACSERFGHSGAVADEPRDPDPEGLDPDPDQVATAQAQLDLARRSGEVGSIAIAHLNLATTLAALGEHPSAIAQYQSLIAYVDLASGDEEREVQRQLRMISPAAPPPGAQYVDLRNIQTVARIMLAESLLSMGRRDEARTELDRAAPGTRGFGRGVLRKRLAAVRGRMDNVSGPAPLRPQAPDVDPEPPEQVAAADELLATGRPHEAARVALAAIGACAPDQVRTRAQARQVLGMALDAMDQTDDALAVLRDSYADYVTAEDHAAAATIAIAVARRLADRDDRQSAVELLTNALDALGGRAGPATRVQLLIDLGSIQDQSGDDALAQQTLTAAVATAEAAADDLLTLDAKHGLAVVLANGDSSTDDAVEALAVLDECRRGYAERDHVDRATGCDHEAAALLGRLGSFDAAVARYERTLSGYHDLPDDLRDSSWTDEVGDCRLNIAALAGDRTHLVGDPRLFRSGGHGMSHPAVSAL